MSANTYEGKGEVGLLSSLTVLYIVNICLRCVVLPTITSNVTMPNLPALPCDQRSMCYC